jgi:hypothetical protein
VNHSHFSFNSSFLPDLLLRSPFRRGLEPERHGASLLNSFLGVAGQTKSPPLRVTKTS